MQSLAEFLGVLNSGQPQALPDARPEEIADDPVAFCKAVLNSYEFRQYIVHSLTLGSIPPAVISRIMDVAGWPKGTQRHEHTGKDGQPIETISQVRRVIVHVNTGDEEESTEPPYVTH